MDESIPQPAQQQSELLDRMLTIGQAIQQHITENPKKVYQLIVEGVCELTGADCAVLYPYHPSYGEFYDAENVAACGLLHRLRLPRRANKRIGLTARVHQRGEVINEDIGQAEPSVRETPFIVREEIKAFMGLSLKIGDNIIGILYVDYRQPHQFSDEEKRIIRLFGQQAAMAVSNSWSYRRANIQTEAVTKLKTVGQMLVSAEEPQGLPDTLDRVLSEIAHSALEVLDADIVDLYQYIQARDEFILPATLVGERWQPDIAKTKIYEDDVLIRAISSGAPQYLQDAQETAQLTADFEVVRNDVPDKRFVIREGVLSSAIIPLVARGETVGIMFVNYRTPQYFNVEQQDVIESFAAQAALAIYNARLFQLERTQRRQSERLREVARIVNTPVAREQVADLILEQLEQVIDYDSASVQVIQGDRRYLLGSQRVQFDPNHPVLLRNLAQDPLIGKIVKDKQPLVLSNVKDEPLWDSEIPETARVNSWMGIPLVVRDQVIGLLTVDHTQAGYYSPEDAEIAAAFANHAALALRNAELYHKLENLDHAVIELSKVHNPEQLYNTLLRSVIETLDCDYCTIFLLEADNILVSRLSDGRLFVESPKLRFAPGEGLAGWVYQHEKSLLVNDTSKEKRYISDPGKEIRPRSIILSPLRRGKKAIGVISADLERTDAFTENDLHILDTLALNAGVVLDNIEYFHDFQVLHDAAAELAKQPNLEKVYQTAVESALETLHCSHCTIFRLDRAAGELVAEARVGAPQPAAAVRRFKLGEGLAGKVALSKQSLFVPDAAKEKDFVKGGVKPRTALRSIILAPVKIENEVVGVMSADQDEIDGFSEHNLEILETLALDVGIAINVCRQQDRLKAIADFQQAISDILPVERQLEQIYDKMSGLMDTSSMFIALCDWKAEFINFPLVYRDGQLIHDALKVEGQPYVPRPFGVHHGFTEWVLDHKEPLLIENFETWPHKKEIEPQFCKELKCCLLAPAFIQNEVIAVIGLQNFDQPRVFDEADRDLLMTIAQQAAIALENARLYQEFEDRIDDLNALNQVGQTMTSGIRLREPQILDLIHTQASKLMSMDNMYIALYDEPSDTVRFGFVMEQGQRLPDEELQPEGRYEPRSGGAGRTEEIIRTRQPIFHRTQAESVDWYAQAGHKEYIGAMLASWIGVPMSVGKKVLGVIAAYDPEQDYVYDDNDLQVLQTLASQAAIALDNARLYYEVNQALARRVEALSTLTEVGQTLTAGLRLQEDEVLKLVYEQARNLTGATDMYFALYDDGTAMIRFPLALEKGERKEYPPRQADLKRRGKIEEIIHTRQPLLHRTKQESEDWYGQPGHQEFIGRVPISWLGVPMIVGERVLGVIALWDWQREFAYDELDLQILNSMADQAAITLDNARLYYEVNQALERRAEALGTLNEVGQRLTSRLQEDEILELIYDEVRELTETKNIYLALYDEKSDTIAFKLLLEKGQRLDVDQQPGFAPRKIDRRQLGKTEAVILERRPILHRTRAEEAAWYRQPGHRQYFDRLSASHLAVPMLIGERAIGAIAVYDWDKEYAYTEQDLEVLTTMASQAAIALENANLYQALERRVEDLSALHEIGQEISAILELDQILKNIAQDAATLVRARRSLFLLVDLSTKQLIKVSGYNYPSEHLESITYDQVELGVSGWVLEHKESALVTDAQTDPRNVGIAREKAREFGTVPLIVAPLMVRQQVKGTLTVTNSKGDAPFTQDDLQLVEMLANQAAVAVENARLFEAMRRVADERQARLALLQQITARMVRAGLEPDEVLELVAQAVNESTESDLTSIYLYDQEAADFTRGVQVRGDEKVVRIDPKLLPDLKEFPSEIAQSQQAMFVGNVQANPEDYSFAIRHDLQASAGLPLTIVDTQGMRTTVGILFVNFKQPHSFSEDEQEILHHLANQAAVAIAYASAQASAQAREQLAALGTAAASLQHRLGNTINVILPAVMRLRYRVGKDEVNTQILDTIERNALFATEVINRMQTPLRPESFVRTNINSLIRDAVQKCLQEKERFPEAYLTTNLPEISRETPPESDEARSEIMIIAELDEQVPKIFVRSGQITEVFRVLVENGIKAIHPQAGTVVVKSYITSYLHRSCVEVTVRDTGKGIDEKTKSRLFKQPVPRKVFGEGAGLGLWLSHFIVRSHQGNLRLHVTEVDKGSTFLVRLPILDQLPPAEAI